MKIIRYQEDDASKINYGKLESEKVYKILNSPFENEIEISNIPLKLSKTKILSPVSPGKIICIATNFVRATGVDSHMIEPMVFLKGQNTITQNGNSVHLPFNLKCWGESELGFVIKKTIKRDLNT